MSWPWNWSCRTARSSRWATRPRTPTATTCSGLAVGSEGTFGIVTQATVRLTRQPQAVRTLLAIFDTVDDATQTVSDIIAAGIVPAALEMMDAVILQTVEDAFHFGFPRDAGAILIIELDGLAAGLDAQAARVRAICEPEPRARDAPGGRRRKTGQSLGGAQKGRRHAGPPGALVRHPGLRHPALEAAGGAARHRRDRPASTTCASPMSSTPATATCTRSTLFDERDPDEVQRVMAASHEILELCVGLGGTLTGEHGIGVEKRDYMPLLFPPETLRTMEDLRAVFNPAGLCNPGKVLPTSHGCAYEMRPRTGAVAV